MDNARFLLTVCYLFLIAWTINDQDQLTIASWKELHVEIAKQHLSVSKVCSGI